MISSSILEWVHEAWASQKELTRKGVIVMDGDCKSSPDTQGSEEKKTVVVRRLLNAIPAELEDLLKDLDEKSAK